MSAPGRHRAGGRHRVNPHTLTRVWTPRKPPRKPQGVGERWAGPVITVLVLAMLVVLSPEPSHRSSAVGDGTAGAGVFPSVARPAPAPAVPAVRVVPRVVEVRSVPLAQVLPVVDPTEVAAPAVQAVVPVAEGGGVVASSVRPRPYVPPVHTHPTTQVPPPASSAPPTTPPVTTTPPPTTTPPTPSTAPPVLCVPGQEVTR